MGQGEPVRERLLKSLDLAAQDVLAASSYAPDCLNHWTFDYLPLSLKVVLQDHAGYDCGCSIAGKMMVATSSSVLDKRSLVRKSGAVFAAREQVMQGLWSHLVDVCRAPALS
jgi:hypothetical protein